MLFPSQLRSPLLCPSHPQAVEVVHFYMLRHLRWQKKGSLFDSLSSAGWLAHQPEAVASPGLGELAIPSAPTGRI